MKTSASSVANYIAEYPAEVQEKLRQLRKMIQTLAPGAEESVSYGMPAYKLHGKPLAYFGGFKNHIGFYPTPTGTDAFADELSGYKTGRGSVQFPLQHALPASLIQRMLLHRMELLSTKHSSSSNKSK